MTVNRPAAMFNTIATVADAGRPEPPAFPWAATVAVFVAGLVLSGVVFYQLGWQRGSAAALSTAAAAAPTPVTPPATATTEYVEAG